MSQVLPRRMGCGVGRAVCSVAFGRHRRVAPVAFALLQQQPRRTETTAPAPSLAELATRRLGGRGRTRGGGGEEGGCNIVQQHSQRAFSATSGGKTNPIKAKITGSLLDARVHVVGNRGMRFDVNLFMGLAPSQSFLSPFFPSIPPSFPSFLLLAEPRPPH